MSTNASLFFAFYEASALLAAPGDTSLLLWLEGGRGCSCLLSNFLQLGPYFLSRHSGNGASLSPNPSTWNRRFGLLFHDSPLAPASVSRRPPHTSPRASPQSLSMSSPHSSPSLTPARPTSALGLSSSLARATQVSTSLRQLRTSSPRTQRCQDTGGSVYAAWPSGTGWCTQSHWLPHMPTQPTSRGSSTGGNGGSWRCCRPRQRR
ncbi:hypothetical protein ZWY2020_040041 [Hordeum vulgare]|nr:hypothetical protein ZWY2020_040041 [Hordeum vulgare]